MQYALKYAGPPAAALGVSLTDLSAAIGIMTNAGMGGEQAGTTLRAALLSLLSPSEQNSKLMEKMGIAVTDAKGNFVGLSQLVKNMYDFYVRND
jgi:TP901 family phage tail tape measure protein